MVEPHNLDFPHHLNRQIHPPAHQDVHLVDLGPLVGVLLRALHRRQGAAPGGGEA